jgi:hypothetical protein
MNKGIGLANGEFINFMNADDWFVDGAFKLVEDVSKEGNPQYIFGDLNRILEDGTVGVHKGNLNNWKIHTPIGHQALFVNTDVLKRLLFDEQYNIMADYNQMIHLIKEKLEYAQINEPLANFRLGGFSTVDRRKDKERFSLQLRHFGLFWAITSFIRQTKKPIIYHMVRALSKIKNILQPIKD